MKFPHSMLLDFVRTDLDATALGDLLTMAGFELEGIDDVEGEPVLDIKVMSNRGDGLSVFGLSREVLAKDPASAPTDLYQQAVHRFASQTFTQGPDVVSIETDDCTRYAAAFFDAPVGETPEWMAKRLRQSGMRPISLLVDVTNYVLLEIGQPLHAFDRDRLSEGRIVVRKAREGEKITTLNGDEHELRPDQMMICDADKPVAVAGVMGGAESEVTEATKHVLLESAHFVNTSIRRTRKQLNLNTEASYRFERSVDRELTLAGLRRAVALLSEITGNPIAASSCAVMGPDSASRTVDLRASRASLLLGMTITSEEAASYLRRLGFAVSGEGDLLHVELPTWRQDISREVDLVEELGRVHGYERIPEALPTGQTTMGGVHGKFLQRDQLAQALIRLGYQQMVSHSLRIEHPLDLPTKRIAPRVPASPEYAILRNSLLPGLAEAFRKNGGRDLHLFELGRVFSFEDVSYDERTHLAVLASGAVAPPRRKGDVVPGTDFFSVKASLEDALASVGVKLVLGIASVPDDRFHPTRQALILAAGEPVGILGQIHPDVALKTGLPEDTVMAECSVNQVLAHASAEVPLRSISRNPAIDRDIAVLASKALPFETIDKAIREAAGDLLEKLNLFDVYEGANLPAGTHSLGVRLRLRKLDGTFTDEEANRVREKVVAALALVGATTR